MCVKVSRRPKVSVTLFAKFLNAMRLLLTALIASAGVSCSLFPKRELNGSAEEKPKIAQDVLSSLAGINTNLESTYASLSRGLDDEGQQALDLLVYEAVAKGRTTEQKANLIKSAFDLMIDIKAARLDDDVFKESVDHVRSLILLFDAPLLRHLREVGRTNPDTALFLETDASKSSNVLAK